MTELAATLPILKTRRLILRGVTLEDAPSIQKYFNDYEVIGELAARVPWPYPDNGVIDFLTNIVLPRQVTITGPVPFSYKIPLLN